MAAVKRQVLYFIQDNYKNCGWFDHTHGGYHESQLERAKRDFEERRTNPIWLDDGNRRWRLIKRTINDYIVES
jgi:hypothetical protein